MTRTIVVGLDGAHWELLDPWIGAGELPALERIREEGVWGDLESCLPPVTCPNWQCYATGKNPGKLGAFWWELLDREARTVETVDSTAFEAPALWDYLNAREFSTAVVNMPTTYPPRPLDGVMVAGGPNAADDGYTAPSDLQADLEREYGYRVRPTDVGRLPDNKAAVAEEVCDIVDARFDAALDLAGEHDFVHLTVFYVNVLQHFFWDDPVVRDVWKRIDANLERILDRDADLVVLSDHGSTPIDRVFNVNAWLEREGYLALERGTADLLASLGLTTGTAKRALGALGEGWYARAKAVVPDALAERVPDESGAVARGGKAEKIDWDDSAAVAGGQGPVYALAADPAERERVGADLAADLEAVADPETGGSPVRAAVPAGEVYGGDRMEHAPDVVLDQAPGWHVAGAVGRDDAFADPGRWAAENKRTGLFAFHGPDFAGGVAADGGADATVGEDATDEGPGEASILDLAPTILHLHGLPVPETLDGEVLDGVYAEGSTPAETDPAFGPEYASRGGEGRGPTDATRDRLEDLGYL